MLMKICGKWFESNVILDRYKTIETAGQTWLMFESNVILDRYKTNLR